MNFLLVYTFKRLSLRVLAHTTMGTGTGFQVSAHSLTIYTIKLKVDQGYASTHKMMIYWGCQGDRHPV